MQVNRTFLAVVNDKNEISFLHLLGHLYDFTPPYPFSCYLKLLRWCLRVASCDRVFVLCIPTHVMKVEEGHEENEETGTNSPLCLANGKSDIEECKCSLSFCLSPFARREEKARKRKRVEHGKEQREQASRQNNKAQGKKREQSGRRQSRRMETGSVLSPP